jgi:hypothetical protein
MRVDQANGKEITHQLKIAIFKAKEAGKIDI